MSVQHRMHDLIALWFVIFFWLFAQQHICTGFMTGLKPLSMPVAIVGYMYGFVLQTASTINFSPNLSMVGELGKFTGHKYFLPALKPFIHLFVCSFIYSSFCSFVSIQLFLFQIVFFFIWCFIACWWHSRSHNCITKN